MHYLFVLICSHCAPLYRRNWSLPNTYVLHYKRQSVYAALYPLATTFHLYSSQENKRKNLIQIRFLLCMFWIFMRRWKTGKLLCGRQPGRSRQHVLSEYFIVNHFPSESWKLFKSEISYFLHKSNTDYQEWSWRWNAMRISKLVICHGLAIWLHTYLFIILLLFYKLHEYVNLFMYMIWFCDMNDLLKVKTIWCEYFSWQRV